MNETPELSVLAKVRADDAALCERLRDFNSDPALCQDLPALLEAAARIEALSALVAEACHNRDGLQAKLDRTAGYTLIPLDMPVTEGAEIVGRSERTPTIKGRSKPA